MFYSGVIVVFLDSRTDISELQSGRKQPRLSPGVDFHKNRIILCACILRIESVKKQQKMIKIQQNTLMLIDFCVICAQHIFRPNLCKFAQISSNLMCFSSIFAQSVLSIFLDQISTNFHKFHPN